MCLFSRADVDAQEVSHGKRVHVGGAVHGYGTAHVPLLHGVVCEAQLPLHCESLFCFGQICVQSCWFAQITYGDECWRCVAGLRVRRTASPKLVLQLLSQSALSRLFEGGVC